MCGPVAIAAASFVVGAAQSVVGFMGQQAAYEQQEALYESNRRNALMAFQEKQKSSNIRIIQEREAAATQSFDASLEARRARASNVVAAGESGIAGPTVTSLLGNIYGEEGRFLTRTNKNLDWTVQQLELEKKGQSYEALDRINSVPRGTKPSFLEAGLRIAASGISSFGRAASAR